MHSLGHIHTEKSHTHGKVARTLRVQCGNMGVFSGLRTWGFRYRTQEALRFRSSVWNLRRVIAAGQILVMWQSLCCSVRKKTSTPTLSKEESTEAPAISLSVTTEHKEGNQIDAIEKPRDESLTSTNKQELELVHQPNVGPSTTHERQKSHSQDNFRARSLSASDTKRARTGKSWGLEGISEGEISRSTLQVNSNQSIVACTSSSSESFYQTPPTSRHPSVSNHPLGKTKKAGSPTSGSSPPPMHSLPRGFTAPSPPRDKSSYIQELLHKMEENKLEQQKQHQDLMKLIADFTEKFEEIMSEIRASRSNERDASTVGVSATECESISESMLPQNTPVSTKVLLTLSKHVSTNQWKFLGRQLNIPEHEINTISANHKESIQEQSYQMLLKWTQSI